MGLFNRKSNLQKIAETVGDSLDIPSALKFDLPDVAGSGGKALKAGLIAAGGLAGLTAGSAGISSLRHHREGAGDDS
jgi:hypothetical protein